MLINRVSVCGEALLMLTQPLAKQADIFQVHCVQPAEINAEKVVGMP